MSHKMFILCLLVLILLQILYILTKQQEAFSEIVYEQGAGPIKSATCKYSYNDATNEVCCVTSSHQKISNSCYVHIQDHTQRCNEKCQDKSQRCKIDACINHGTLDKCLNSAPDCDPETIKQKCNTRCDDKSQKCKVDACISSNSLDKCSNAAPDCDPEVIRKKFLQTEWKTFCAYTMKALNVDECVRKGVQSNQSPGAGFDASTSAKGSKIGCKGIYC